MRALGAPQRRLQFGPQAALHRLTIHWRPLRLPQLAAKRLALGLPPHAFLGAGHCGLLRAPLHRRQFGAQVRHRLLALLARRALLVDLAQRAALGGAGPLLRDGHLLAGVLQLRRELGTQLLQLSLQPLDLACSCSPTFALGAVPFGPSPRSQRRSRGHTCRGTPQ
ncbi:hypothetical protein [Cupriavidus necator]